MSKEKLIDEMVEIMPFNLSENVKPYIYEAMEVYKQQEIERLTKENEELRKDLREDNIVCNCGLGGMNRHYAWCDKAKTD